jgi:hypothetical protein
VSPKNKGKFGKGKPAVEPQDEFVSGVQRVSERLRPHARKIFLFLGVVLVGVAGWSFIRHSRFKKAVGATKDYTAAVDTSRREIVPPPAPADGDAGVPEPEPPTGEPDELGDSAEVTYPSEADRDRAVLAALDEVGGKIAGQARLLRAASHLRLGEWDLAIDEYRKYDGPPELDWIAREGVGYALEGKAAAEKDAGAREAGYKAALEEFKNVQPDATLPGHDLALWHQGRLMAELGDKAGAIAMFEKVRDLEPPSSLKGSAEGRIAMLKAKTKK